MKRLLFFMLVVLVVAGGVSNIYAQKKDKDKEKDKKEAVAAADALKLGVFDIQKILRDSKVVQDYRQKFGQEMAAKRKTFSEKQKSAVEIEEKLKKEGQRLSLEERKSLEEKLAVELKELKRLKEDLDAEIQKSDRELTQKTLQEIGGIIKQIFDKEGYTIIFEKSGAGIAIFKDTVDITGKIIKLYDKK